MKITSETTAMEVKEKIEVTLQMMFNVQKGKSDAISHAERVSEQIQNREISAMMKEDEKADSFNYFLDKIQNGFSKKEDEKLSDEEKMQYYLENALGRTEQDITPGAKALSDALQSGELQGPSLIKRR